MKKNIDLKYLGIPNICFSLADKVDTREAKYKKQRIDRGFDDSETWSLSDTIALFIIPRLERYQEITNDFLVREPELVAGIDSFLNAMKLTSRNNGDRNYTEEETQELYEGLKKFPEIFMSLWW